MFSFFGPGSAGGGLEEILYGMCEDRLDTVPAKRSLDGAPPLFATGAFGSAICADWAIAGPLRLRSGQALRFVHSPCGEQTSVGMTTFFNCRSLRFVPPLVASELRSG